MSHESFAMHPSNHASNQLWKLSMGLDLPEGVAFQRIRGRGVIIVDPSVPYPDHLTDPRQERPLSDILLSGATDLNKNRVYPLPSNSASLASILNEAAGATDSFECAPDESRTVDILRTMFSSIIANLAELKDREGLIPDGLSYGQFLVEKNSDPKAIGFKLLPPLTLQQPETNNLHTSWMRAGRLLIKSMVDGCDNDSQRNLVSSLIQPIGKEFVNRG